MAVTYTIYNPAKTVSASLARGVALVMEGRAEITKAYQAINAATNGGASVNNLINGEDFGALDSTNAQLMWDNTWGVTNLMNSIDAGGFASMLASLYKGEPG